MELKLASDLVDLTLDTNDGATSPILFYHKGYISSDGLKARWYASQVTADEQITIHRVTDYRGTVTKSSKIFNFDNIYSGLEKTGTMSYVNRMSVNRHSQVIQQTAPTRRWVFYQPDWVNQTFVKTLYLDIQPDSGSSIDYITRYSNHLYLRVIDGSSNWYVYYIDLSTHPSHGTVTAVTDSFAVTADETEICAGERYLYIMESGDLTVYYHGNFVTPYVTYSSVTSDLEGEIREIDHDDIFWRVSGSSLYEIEVGESTTISTALETDTTNYRFLSRGDRLWLEGINVSKTPNTDDEHNDNWYIIGELGEINANLDGIVSEICQEVGLSTDNTVVTDLAGTIVQGFLVNNYSISDAYLKQLMIAYQFDMIESGGDLKFVPRGESSSQTINVNRLGAMTVSGQINNNFPERLGRTLEASRLIPREVKVIYLEQQKDYDQTEQSILRQDAQNRDQQVLDMSAFAWTDSIARQIADKIIALFFSEREQYVFYVSAYYYDIEPSDIITLTIDGESTELRVTETQYSFPGVMQVQAVFENVNDYTSDIAGVASASPAQSFPEYQQYETFILDVPYLFDGDADDSYAGNYAMLRSLGSTFNTVQILQGNIGGKWNTKGNVDSEIIVGNCTTVLSDGTVDLVDVNNSVTVQIDSAYSLSTVTTKEFYNETNMCAIGNEVDGYEILLFKTVTEIGSGDGTFQLTNFIRGIKGTDHLTGNHAIGDTFIFIDSSKMANLLSNRNNIGKNYDYTGVELGDSLPDDPEDIEAYNSTLINRRGLPFSVTQLRAKDVDGSNDIVITWKRRARYDGEWNDGRDVPETETTESYEIDILDGSTVKRTISASTNTATYTAAQQTADWGSVLSTLNCKVYKLHPTFGRGIEKEFNGSV